MEGLGAVPAFGGVDVIGVGWFLQTYPTHHVLYVKSNGFVNTDLWSFGDALMTFVAVPPFAFFAVCCLRPQVGFEQSFW